MANPNLNADKNLSAAPDKEFENSIRPSVIRGLFWSAPTNRKSADFYQGCKIAGRGPGSYSFSRPSGAWQKPRLGRIVANELGVNIKETSGPVIEKPSDLAGLLTNLEAQDVLFIDEIHRLSTVVEEYLYAAMEDYRIDIMIDTGPNARSIQLTLNPFTLIGATTRSGLLTAPLLSPLWH